jgi:hypothetical protein
MVGGGQFLPGPTIALGLFLWLSAVPYGNSQIATACTKPFSSLLCLHQPFCGSGF